MRRLLGAAAIAASCILLAGCHRAAGRAEEEASHGLELAKAGKLDDAAAAFARAAVLDPQNLKARYNGGLALLELGHPIEGAAEFAAFIKLKPPDALGWFHHARAELRAGQPDVSMASLQKSVEAGFADYKLLTADGTFRQLYP